MLPFTSNLPATYIVQAPPAIGTWSQAFTLWLDSRTAPNTRRAYRKAWELFLSSTGKMPWEVGKADVSLWVDDQHTQGLSPETIQ